MAGYSMLNSMNTPTNTQGTGIWGSNQNGGGSFTPTSGNSFDIAVA